MIDIRNKQRDGLVAAELLEHADIIVNKNTIPFDASSSPWRPSGIRLGTPAVTTRGMKEKEMKKIALLIDRALEVKTEAEQRNTREAVHTLTGHFPIYEK